MFCIIYKHVCNFFNDEKNGTNIHLEHPYYLHPKTGSMVAVCLVQGLLEVLKQSNPLHLISQIFRFDNYCLKVKVIIMGDTSNYYCENDTSCGKYRPDTGYLCLNFEN